MRHMTARRAITAEPVAQAGPACSRRASDGWLVFGFALSLYLATTGGSMATDIMSYEVTKGIVEHGTVAMSYNVFQMDAHRGVDGRYYAPYGIGHAVYSIPFYALARVAERWTGLGGRQAGGTDEGRFRRRQRRGGGAHRLDGISLRVAPLGGRSRGGRRPRWRSDLARSCGPYAKFGFTRPLATLCVLFGTYATWVGTRLESSGACWFLAAPDSAAPFSSSTSWRSSVCPWDCGSSPSPDTTGDSWSGGDFWPASRS